MSQTLKIKHYSKVVYLNSLGQRITMKSPQPIDSVVSSLEAMNFTIVSADIIDVTPTLNAIFIG